MNTKNILEREIKNLENKSSKTKAEENILASKKKELERLLAEENKSNTSGGEPNRTALYVGLGIVGIVLVGLVVILVRRNKKKKS